VKKERWFEDYIPGSVHEFGSTQVNEEEIIAFASQFDPQSFHLDREPAETSVFGGLVASGWHTASMTMRMLVDYYLSEVSSLGSPGIDELRWLLPVRAGDELTVRVRVLEARRSGSRPDRGIVRSYTETLKQNNEVVMHMTATTFVRCQLHGY
jgi:acyl dehydratase